MILKKIWQNDKKITQEGCIIHGFKVKYELGKKI